MEIIYIEDDATNRAVLKAMLASAGVAMAEADSARSGLQMIGDRRFDLVIMDLRMPEVSGLTAIRQLRAREGESGRVPIIVVSAELTEGTRDLCRSAGADRFLCKPITMIDLFGEIGAALAGSETAMLS